MYRRMTTGPTRRDALKLIGAGVTAPSAPAARAAWVPELVNPRATFFPLTDVRLGEGPFLAAQGLDAAYLLRLEPDRMLANFRVNAGLAPKAPVYGGWESQEPWIEILATTTPRPLPHRLRLHVCIHGRWSLRGTRRLHRERARNLPAEDRRLAHRSPTALHR